MGDFKDLKQAVYEAYMQLFEFVLVLFTFGNVSVEDREKAVYNSAVLEELTKMTCLALQINPEAQSLKDSNQNQSITNGSTALMHTMDKNN